MVLPCQLASFPLLLPPALALAPVVLLPLPLRMTRTSRRARNMVGGGGPAVGGLGSAPHFCCCGGCGEVIWSTREAAFF